MKYQKKNGKFVSPVTDPNFFLSHEGAQDASVELQKTIEIFSRELPTTDQHPQCQYPARYDILRKHFALAKPVVCPSLTLWKKNYAPTTINVLYGSQYISTPTSAFGHSFFLIDSNKTLEYMRVTYNYGAEIPEDIGARLVIDGLGGGFKGTISVVPLYERLHSYNNIENRDIWEYKLALTDEEQDFLIKYFRELEKYFSAPYYFLNGNCASEILEILNTMRPGLNLKTSSPLFTSPQEIFRALEKKKLISSVKLRPSLQKQLDLKISQLSKSQKKEFLKIINGKREVKSDVPLMDTVLIYLAMKRQKNYGVTPEHLKSLERSTLLARSEVEEPSVIEYPREYWPEAPHKAQGPNQIGIGRTHSSKQKLTKLMLRPAFHDQMQTDAGFLPNSSIDILTLDASLPDEEELQLDTFTFGRITNFREVTIYDPFAPSWILGGKVMRNKFLKNKQRYHLELSSEIGFATSIGQSTFLVYALAGFDYRDRQTQPFGILGIGPRIGVIGSHGRFKTFLSHRRTWQSADARTPQKHETDFQLRYNLNQDWDVIAEHSYISAGKNFGTYFESSASFRYSF